MQPGYGLHSHLPPTPAMIANFKPLLAAPVDLDKLRFPVLVSPKLDGIRCIVLDGKALSRKLKPIPNDYIRNWIEANVPDGVDGEILLRDTTAPFADVSSAVMSKDGEPDFVFAAFDWLDTEGWRETLEGVAEKVQFQDRLYTLEQFFDKDCGLGLGVHFIVVPHQKVTRLDELMLVQEGFLAAGYEGTMIRDPEGRYKFGRSTVKEGILLKMKEFVDEEAIVIDVVEEMANHNEATVDALGHTKRSSAKAGKVGKGVLGALKCRTADGAEFEIGSGFTAAQRADIWASYQQMVEARKDGMDTRYASCVIGDVVKFKHQPPPGGRPAGVAPRFPVFLGFRHEDDL